MALRSAVFGLALTYLPQLPSYVPYNLSKQAEAALPIIRNLLKFLWGAAIVKNLNGIASHVALNSWKGNVWKDEEEVVVVTGGSSGIGALVVRGFAARGVKVAILDLNESKDSLGKSLLGSSTFMRFSD